MLMPETKRFLLKFSVFYFVFVAVLKISPTVLKSGLTAINVLSVAGDILPGYFGALIAVAILFERRMRREAKLTES